VVRFLVTFLEKMHNFVCVNSVHKCVYSSPTLCAFGSTSNRMWSSWWLNTRFEKLRIHWKSLKHEFIEISWNHSTRESVNSVEGMASTASSLWAFKSKTDKRKVKSKKILRKNGSSVFLVHNNQLATPVFRASQKWLLRDTSRRVITWLSISIYWSQI